MTERKERPAIETMLATMNTDLTNSRQSLLNLCLRAQFAPGGFAPGLLTDYERQIWCSGFSEAMAIVAAYIEGRKREPMKWDVARGKPVCG